MAPGFRSRIATGLLLATVVLPVPVVATTAAAPPPERTTPADHPPGLALADGPPGGGMVAPPPAGGNARVSWGYQGRPDWLPRFPEMAAVPELPDYLPGLPDVVADLPDSIPGFPDRPPYFPGAPPVDRPEGLRPKAPDRPVPDSVAPSAPAPAPAARSSDAPDPVRARPSAPASPAAGGGTKAGPPPAAPPHRTDHAPAPALSPPGAAPPWRSPAHRPGAAGQLAQRPYQSLRPTPTAPAGPPSATPETTDGEQPATTGPSALENPAARVERVLPMGAGLALTGLGLAFFGLRLRRR
ncbi:hypothetical protein [Streptomyces celluloflavus]|uniref:hypothetical protein n=1 Tax=Streptomyces celluloflavus TaxID=58344 RepID=UPI00368D3ED0